MTQAAAATAYRTPDERFAGLPGPLLEPHYAEVGGVRLHYVDEGPRDAAPIVCFHGEPSWSYLYRKMVGPLVAAGHRVVCPDFAGFGRSDKPSEAAWYTYDRHVALMAELLDGLGLTGVTAVVQDWGGPIGLRWAVEHAESGRALVVLNTALFTGHAGKGFMAWRTFAESNPDLPIGQIIQAGTATELDPEIVAAYDAPFPDAASKAGASRFPLIVPLTPDDPGAPEMLALEQALRSWDKPALVAFSDADPIFPYPRAGQRFVDMLPTVQRQQRIAGASHFLQEDRGPEIAQLIAGFLAELN